MTTLIVLVDGTVPVAADFNSNFSGLNTEVRSETRGGTGQSAYTTGDLLYGSAANTLSRIAAGSTGLVLTMVAGIPTWSAGSAGAGSVRGLIATNNAATPTSKYDLQATLVTLRNPVSGATRSVAATTTTNDIAAATTTNGRDQAAAFTASSWVYFYFTGTGSGSPTTLSSASATGPTLLAGQTEWAFAGAVFNNATPRLVATRIFGSRVWYEAAQSALATGAATTQTTVSLVAFVPPNAQSVGLDTILTGAASTATSTLRVVAGADYSTLLTAGPTQAMGKAIWAPNIGQAILYLNSTTAATLRMDVSGYSIPNGDSG